MKKFISILAVMAVLFTFAVPLSPVSVQALSFRPTFQLKSESGILYHMDTQTVVFEKNADKQCSPAQTVQIMTAAIAIEKAQSMEAIIEIPPNVYNEFEKYRSRYPAEQFPYNEVTTSYLEEGEQFRVQDLISAMLLESSCEAAYALAYVIGEGSIQNFVNMMNEKAESLGAASTHFTNPHGLYDESQYTTARDMLKITEYALGLPGFAELSAAEQVKTGATNINPEGYEFNNVNLMMNSTSEYYYKGTKGIKTGNSNQSLRCLVTRASRDGQNYLAVLFGAPFDKDEYDDDIYTHLNDAAELFEWAFTNLEHKVVLEENQEIGSPKIKYAKGKDYINLKPANDVKCMWLATVDTSNIITRQVYPSDLRIYNLLETEHYGIPYGFWKELFNNNIGWCCIDTNTKRMVSVAFLSIYRRIPCPDCPDGMVAELCGVFTSPEYRGRGYATECCRMLVEYAKRYNIDYIHCDNKRAAESLYSRLGFINQADDEMRMWLPISKQNK